MGLAQGCQVRGWVVLWAAATRCLLASNLFCTINFHRSYPCCSGPAAHLAQASEKFFSWGTIAPGISNGESEIRFTKLEFQRPQAVASAFARDEGFTGLIQAVVFEVNDRDLIGYPSAQGMRFCCTKELVSKTKCHQDRLIVQVSKSLKNVCFLTDVSALF